jgi:hypothetical protein
MKSLIKKLSTLALFAFVMSSPVIRGDSHSCEYSCEKKVCGGYSCWGNGAYYDCYNSCMTDCSNSCYNANKCTNECGVQNGRATKDGQQSCTDCRNIRTKCQNECKK